MYGQRQWAVLDVGCLPVYFIRSTRPNITRFIMSSKRLSSSPPRRLSSPRLLRRVNPKNGSIQLDIMLYTHSNNTVPMYNSRFKELYTLNVRTRSFNANVEAGIHVFEKCIMLLHPRAEPVSFGNSLRIRGF